MIIMSSENLNEIFFPHHNQQLKRAEEEEINYAHYTNADTAYKIIKNQEIWLRKVTVMNDYREFEHGKDSLIKIIDDTNEGKSFREIFDSIAPNVFDIAYAKFKQWGDYIKDDFYISCFSEHRQEEDKLGKLSMWRAYGGHAGVAIIFKRDFFRNSHQGLSFSSVIYTCQIKGELIKEITRLGNSILSQKDNVKSTQYNLLENYLFNVFRFAALCNKHQGFEEEKEWRLIATASLLPEESLTTQEIVTIQGTPQNIVKINLENADFGNLKFKDMIDKIIIGPSERPDEIRESIISALKDIGAENPEAMVNMSDIPLRINH